MPTNHRNEDTIRFTEVERALMIALLKGNRLVYELGRSMDEDNDEDIRYSSGTLYPALKRLKAMEMVTKISGVGAKRSAGSVYRVTPIGRQMLRLEIMRLQNQIDLARDRLKR